MRIIEKKEPEIELDCPDCKSRLAVNQTDIRPWCYTDYGGDSNSGYDTRCPVCASEFNIADSKIPQGWRDVIRARGRK